MAELPDRPDVLFCTDAFASAYKVELSSIAPTTEVVELQGGVQVSGTDIERITLAHFSNDAWPERAPTFMSVVLNSPNLRWLHTMSAGVDHPIFATLVDRGVVVTTSSGSSAAPIASTAMMYLLALSRNLPASLRAQADHRWEWQRWNELAGRSIAVLGYGPIGQEVVRLSMAFGMIPTIVRRSARGDEPCSTRTLAELVSIASDNDIVVVALPLAAETRALVSREVIDAMRPGALFVNVGRGEVVDQQALTEALTEGRLGGAGLDVFEVEPLTPDDPLWSLPNVIITPHSSGSSDGTARRANAAFLANLERWMVGDALANQVGAGSTDT